MRAVQMTKTLTSQMFQNFKDMMWDKKLRLYDKQDPLTQGHEPYIEELLELQAKVHSKHVITVEAPQVQGKHDDRSDAIVRMVWAAANNISKEKYITGSYRSGGGSSLSTTGKTFAQPNRVRSKDPKRTASKFGRGRY